jgi:hypothetical protein
MNRMMAPFAAPQKRRLCRENATGSGARALWGQQWTRLPFFLADGTSTATTGA